MNANNIYYRKLLLLLVIMLAATDICAQDNLYDGESADRVYLRKDIFTSCWDEKESFSRNEQDHIVYKGEEWGGLVALIGLADWSDYEKVVFEFANPVPADVQIYMDFGESGDEERMLTKKGNTWAEFKRGTLDWSHVHALVLQPSAKCTLEITDVYLVRPTFTAGKLKYHVINCMPANQVSTSLVKTEIEAWGAWWEPTEEYAPLVRTADGRNVKLVEQYYEDVNQTGVLMQQEVTNLPCGEYEVVLYANSCFTAGRGFDSDMRDYANDVAYVFANGVKKHITCMIQEAISHSDEYTLRVKVNTGRLRIGLGKDKPGTNWHTIQIKSLKLLSASSTPSVELLGHDDLSGALSIPAQVSNGGKTYNVTRLGAQCLVGCGESTTLTIPEGVEEIGWQAFIYSSFTTIKIPSTVSVIGDEAFSALEKNTAINVDVGNQAFCSEDGVLFSKDKKILYRYPEGKTDDSYAIPSTVEILAASAICNEKLRSITIPQNLRECWWVPFGGCTNLNMVICQANTPHELDESIFEETTYSKATLFVPKGRVSTYKSVNPWKKFKTIKEISGEFTVMAMSYTITYGDDLPAFGWDATDKSALTGSPEIKCAVTKKSKPGTYDIVISQGTLTAPSTLKFVNGTLTIKQAPLTISVGNYTKKQGDAMPTFEVKYDGFKNNETKSVLKKQPTVSCKANASSAPGTYDITVSGAQADNYDITYKNGKLTVVKANAIIVKAKSYTINYGEAIPTLEYTTSGGTLKGKPTITCSAGKTGDHPGAGTYDIVVSKGTVTSDNVEYVKGTLTVKKSSLQVSVDDCTKYEGEEMPTFNIKYSGFKNNDNASKLTKKAAASCAATKWSPAGTYTISVSGAESPNYDFKYKSGVLTVKHIYNLILTSQGHGTVNYGSTKVKDYKSFEVKEGSTVTLTFTPDNGYKLSKLTVNGRDVIEKVKDNTYDIGTLEKDLNIIATFNEATGSFSIASMTYSILSAPERTVILDKSSTNREQLTVPETVNYSDEVWNVVGIADNAFVNCTNLKAISLPNSLKSKNMGLSLFTGCNMLAAIIWNADFNMASSVLGAVNNPNLLFYTQNASYAPKEINNVIVNGIADRIVLQDAATGNNNFYCPSAFTATEISYSHTYTMESAYGGIGGWETLALPFTVQQIRHERVGDIVPFAAYDGSAERRPFWLYTYSSSGFVRASGIEANIPYIICMPNNREYDDEYLLSGRVTFSARNAKVASSLDTAGNERPSRGNKTFIAAYKAKLREKSPNVYAMNVVNDFFSESGGYDAGSVFISDLRDIAPFEAVMTTEGAASRVITIEFDETTDFESLPTVYSGFYRVYNINGQLLIQTDNAAEKDRLIKQLPAGVYIVNGNKMIIK